MKDIKILDCTLRDGGYINNWRFGEESIRGIIKNLVDSKVDIIECGFIRNVKYNQGCSVYSCMKQAAEAIGTKCESVLYAVMIEQHNFSEELVPDYESDYPDIIRLTFRKNEWEKSKETVKRLIKKGYKVCVQPVGTTTYNDEELIKLINDVNKLKPYAFYIVDTLGVMYRHDMRKFYYLIDSNLSKGISLGLHSHNNLQMSFANSQEMIRLANNRKVIIDSSCYGMGRGVGNLSTELIADYINKNIKQKYSLIPLLNIVDKYLMHIYAEQRWGYDLPYFLSAIVKCHPNYAAHLLKKETMDIESIEKILCLIPQDDRSEYNADLIEEMYLETMSMAIDDKLSVELLKEKINGREVVILGAGVSIKNYQKDIQEKIRDKFLITTNFITDIYNVDAMFVSNKKRLSMIDNMNIKLDCIISTSNLHVNNSLTFDYASLLGEGDASDNAGAMLIRILKKVGVSKVYLAGFDGFDMNANNNYFIQNYKTALDFDTAKKKNEDISKQLKLALNGIEYEKLTPTKYEI